MEHPDPLNAGQLCFVELPVALGRGTLRGRIGWTKCQRNELTSEGMRQHCFRRGLQGTGRTLGPQGARTAGLQRLTAAAGAPPSD